MVFPWFSYGFPMVYMDSSSLDVFQNRLSTGGESSSYGLRLQHGHADGRFQRTNLAGPRWKKMSTTTMVLVGGWPTIVVNIWLIYG